MGLLDKLTELGEVVKDGYAKHFTEDDLALDDEGERGADRAARRSASLSGGFELDEAGARALLGLAGDANLDEVREAYRRQAQALHPDAVSEGPRAEPARDRLERLLEALEVLEAALLPLPPSR